MADSLHLAYRYRLYPTKAQVSALERTLGVCRDVYNSLVHERTALYETQGKLRLSKISNPKIGDIAIHLHRRVEGDIKTCTIRRTATGKWYACFSCEVEPKPLEPKPLEASSKEVGIDVGLKVFAALSSGEFIENLRFFCRDENALAKAQRKFDKVKNREYRFSIGHSREKPPPSGREIKGRVRTSSARRAAALSCRVFHTPGFSDV